MRGAAVQASALKGRRARIGAISAPRPATPAARKVVPPRNVPTAAPGRPLALAAMPAARFSSSNPDKTTVTANAGKRSRAANASSPRKKASAPRMMSATPATSSARAESEDTEGFSSPTSQRPAPQVGCWRGRGIRSLAIRTRHSGSSSKPLVAPNCRLGVQPGGVPKTCPQDLAASTPSDHTSASCACSSHLPDS